jgi:hypothetical protein
MDLRNGLLNSFCVLVLAPRGGFVRAQTAKAQATSPSSTQEHQDSEVEECVVQFADEADVPALESKPSKSR